MNYFKKLLITIIFLFSSSSILFAENPHYLDFKFILNQSEAGKKAQTFLKNKLDKGIKSLKTKESKLQEEEKKIIQQKKVITPEEYKKKVSELRSKVSKLQTERNALLNSVSKQRTKARNELLKSLNPIVKDFMKQKNIRMVIDKKNILLADESLDITKEIIGLLNKKLKSIKLD